MSSIESLFLSLKDVTDPSVISERLFTASLAYLSGKQHVAIWAALSGRPKTTKSGGEFHSKTLLAKEIRRILLSHAPPSAPSSPTPVAPAPASDSGESTTSSSKRREVDTEWKNHVHNGEEVVLTRHESGIPDMDDLSKVRLYVVKEGDVFRGFLNRQTNKLYKSPSGACRAHLTRDGETNQWRGPSHCLVVRTGIYTPLNKL